MIEKIKLLYLELINDVNFFKILETIISIDIRNNKLAKQYELLISLP